MKNFVKIVLNPKKERSLKYYHPWVFSGAIAKTEGKPKEGEIVEVYSSSDEYLATGHFHEGSIKVRIFSFEKTEADVDFWKKKLRRAYEFRGKIFLASNQHTNAYRLVHGEGDGFPGLIIDIYGNTAVIQSHTLGMHLIKPALLEGLNEIYKDKLSNVYDKSSDTMGKQGVKEVSNQFLKGSESEQIIFENDLKFKVNWIEGQKTGFFLDQRENRFLLQRYSKNKKVLNTFCYSGGFSMYALKGGATEVHSVDSSAKAVLWAEQNATLNGFEGSHKAISMDTFDYLKRTEEKFDIILLDPPAFAKHLSAVENAMVGYRNLNTEGIKRVAPGGLIFTFSCSQVIDRVLFRKLIFQAAAQAKRNVRIIHQLSQGPDHPVSIYHPEGEYLKGLVLLVD